MTRLCHWKAPFLFYFFRRNVIKGMYAGHLGGRGVCVAAGGSAGVRCPCETPARWGRAPCPWKERSVERLDEGDGTRQEVDGSTGFLPRVSDDAFASRLLHLSTLNPGDTTHPCAGCCPTVQTEVKVHDQRSPCWPADFRSCHPENKKRLSLLFLHPGPRSRRPPPT